MARRSSSRKKAAPAAAAAAADTNTNTATTTTSPANSSANNDAGKTAASATAAGTATASPSDEAVLSYLRKRGLGGAAVELTRHLRADKRRREEEGKQSGQDVTATATSTTDGGEGGGEEEMELEYDEARARNSRTPLVVATGGGLGYDLDAAPAIALWGCGSGDDGAEKEQVEEVIVGSGGTAAASDDSKNKKRRADGTSSAAEDRTPEGDKEVRGQEEARRYVRAFTALLTWVLGLPDDPPGSRPAAAGAAANGVPTTTTMMTTTTVESVVERARQEVATGNAHSGSSAQEDGAMDGRVEEREVHGVHVIPEAASAATTTAVAPSGRPATSSAAAPAQLVTSTRHPSSSSHSSHYPTAPHIAPSCKPELLSVTFAAFVHTYCELLESGLEHTAAAFLSTYRRVYEPSHDLSDLDLCSTSQHIVDLNRNVLSHSEAVNDSRTARNAIHQYKKRKAAVIAKAQTSVRRQTAEEEKAAADAIAHSDAEIARYETRYHDATRRASKISSRIANLPFLRRARALRWQISLSTNSYQLLASYLGRGDGVLLPISALLQSRCYFNVEKRDPIPVVPAVVMEDMILGDIDAEDERDDDVRWAAPVDPISRAAEAGEDLRADDVPTILSRSEPLPFPRFYLDPGKEITTEDEAEDAKRKVEFNRALLVNGFRRLEALECRREYEAGMRTPGAVPKPVSASTGKVATGGAAIVEDDAEVGEAYREFADPHSPSVLLSTLCAARPSSGPSWSYGTAGGASAAVEGGAAVGSTMLQESGIDICCARLCPPDGRRVAAGCDDAAVRIWTVGSGDRTGPYSSGTVGGGSIIKTKAVKDTADSVNKPEESAQVLLGHKNGFPIFDLDWNRDGRTLLSAGGDGSIRLWDTAAVGPFGRLANVVKKSHSSGISSTILTPSTGPDPLTSVPGLRSEPMVEVSGAALAAYRGHTPSSPIWSVAFSPSGYYFASAGWDSTARVWTTDNPTPVRILAGHFSPSVNSISWHPNANYVVTAADDKTARLWDVQTGRCVRLLNGASAGLNLVKVCPSGKYVAASDYSGTVHIWDLGSGRKVNELLLPAAQSGGGGTSAVAVQSMSYSACGTALATGGDDCTVRIWDVRGAANHMSNPDYAKSHGYGEGSGPTSLPSDSQLDRRPIGERFRIGAREPVNCFRTRRSVIMDLQYTKRNLLLSVGKYSASAM
mmetsp:Transcript_28558/g.62855  ORF Transcript_28558/g.62855 Transcript_28558/m.62855 type:complete len:1187 (-) Transcript_28558:266-3826(-)